MHMRETACLNILSKHTQFNRGSYQVNHPFNLSQRVGVKSGQKWYIVILFLSTAKHQIGNREFPPPPDRQCLISKLQQGSAAERNHPHMKLFPRDEAERQLFGERQISVSPEELQQQDGFCWTLDSVAATFWFYVMKQFFFVLPLFW